MLRLFFPQRGSTEELGLGMWVSARAQMTRELKQGYYTAIGVTRGNNLLAGIIYHDYLKLGSTGKIELSMAADDPSWCRRGILGGLLYYPFVTLNCHVIVSTTGRNNIRTRRLAKGIGFTERGVIPNYPEAEDTVIYALRREDAARWLPKTGATKLEEAA